MSVKTFNAAYHRGLVRKAREAVENVFSDTNVSPDVTYSDLSDLRADIEIKMEALKEDAKRKGKR